jgi:opacity protein-like surface antigen
VVTDLQLDEQYPFDTLNIVGVVTEKRTGTRFGYHVGADISHFFTASTAIGGGVRYSRATLKLDHDAASTISGAAGGVEVAAGLRFKF